MLASNDGALDIKSYESKILGGMPDNEIENLQFAQNNDRQKKRNQKLHYKNSALEKIKSKIASLDSKVIPDFIGLCRNFSIKLFVADSLLNFNFECLDEVMNWEFFLEIFPEN